MYCYKQPSEGTLQNRCSGLVVKKLKKYVLRTSILALPILETNQRVTIINKPQEEVIN